MIVGPDDRIRPMKAARRSWRASGHSYGARLAGRGAGPASGARRHATPATGERTRVTGCVRLRQPAVALPVLNRGCFHGRAVASHRSTAALLQLAEQAPAAVAGAPFALRPKRQRCLNTGAEQATDEPGSPPSSEKASVSSPPPMSLSNIVQLGRDVSARADACSVARATTLGRLLADRLNREVLPGLVEL